MDSPWWEVSQLPESRVSLCFRAQRNAAFFTSVQEGRGEAC